MHTAQRTHGAPTLLTFGSAAASGVRAAPSVAPPEEVQGMERHGGGGRGQDKDRHSEHADSHAQSAAASPAPTPAWPAASSAWRTGPRRSQCGLFVPASCRQRTWGHTHTHRTRAATPIKFWAGRQGQSGGTGRAGPGCGPPDSKHHENSHRTRTGGRGRAACGRARRGRRT